MLKTEKSGNPLLYLYCKGSEMSHRKYKIKFNFKI